MARREWLLPLMMGCVVGLAAESFGMVRMGISPAREKESRTGPAEVSLGNAVTFRLAWPREAKVELVARGPNQHDFPQAVYEMSRGDGGDYVATVAPVPAGVHFYKFRVDGTDVLDPGNSAVQGFFNGPWSRFELEDPVRKPWTLVAGVPHGKIEQRTYPSDLLGEERPVWVYLPPGYGEGKSSALPVLFLFHGSTYDQRSWVELGRVREIADNLIAEGKIQPLVIAMPFGYNALPVKPGVEPVREYSTWARHLAEELVPWIAQAYRVSDRSRDRAVAGLSLGGAQALQLGFQFPEKFSAIGAFSAGEKGTDDLTARSLPGVSLRLVWFGCGTGDRHYQHNRELERRLAGEGVATVWRDYAGRHTWNVWRQCLAEFLPAAFPARP